MGPGQAGVDERVALLPIKIGAGERIKGAAVRVVRRFVGDAAGNVEAGGVAGGCTVLVVGSSGLDESAIICSVFLRLGRFAEKWRSDWFEHLKTASELPVRVASVAAVLTSKNPFMGKALVSQIEGRRCKQN